MHCNRDETMVLNTLKFIQFIREYPLAKEQIGEESTERLYRHAELIVVFYQYIGLMQDQNNNKDLPTGLKN